MAAQPPGGLVAIAYGLERFWSSEGGEERLIAVYQRQEQGTTFIVQSDSKPLRETLKAHAGDLATLASELQTDVFSTNTAIALDPVHIPKPWGGEIWYTGMEDRGLAGAGHAGRSVPLPWVLSALPDQLVAGRERGIVLLKILAPRPEEVFGDLYFELHEEKREVYVVTAVDESAWPDGTGAIRFGFDPAVRAQYDSDSEFRSAFASAVADYEAVRRKIDEELDRRAETEGRAADREAWLADLPAELTAEEKSQRDAMNRFTALKPLRVGDVVKVPTLTPHSLQHGVRTVEFQTPVYERLIVAFAQKVLTQKHWDTAKAIELMNLEPEPEAPFEVLVESEGVCVERIVDFPDFEVQRYTVAPGYTVSIPSPSDYAVLMQVQGELPLGVCPLQAEQAVLLPQNWRGLEIEHKGAKPLIFLVALPR
ncbi:hypothetical protein [Litorivivens lipolytica]|uniref:hypothetical protein n=1 Tax=Litorivivens lipolytica TaxID=1524264 RepID=UPI0016106823|nr:hypothetical protein [Litorivivens lipolytica]